MKGSELPGFFRAIDERLGKENFRGKAALYLFGGAAAVIAYGSRRGTLDVDAYFDDSGVGERLLEWAGKGSELEKAHGYYLHGANTEL